MAISQTSISAPLRTASGEPTRVIAPDTSRRLSRLVGIFRLLAALTLLAVSVAMRDNVLSGGHPELFRLIAAGWSIAAVFVLGYQRRHPIAGPYRVPTLLGFDIAATTLLIWTGGGAVSGIGGLLVVFVGAGALTLSARHAFFAAALATLAILGEQVLAFTQGMAAGSDFVGAGVLGAVIFAITAAAYPLARRLEESEALAHQRGIDLANLAQLNEYIVQNLRESIVVVDATDQVRLMNEPAATQLGSRTRLAGVPLQQVSPDLSRVLNGWRRGAEPRNRLLSFRTSDGSTLINTHIAPLSTQPDGPVLIFLEDAGLLAEKVQQSKLAALGRLTASIAHEIRNPVGAMSHAGQLLEESAAMGPEEQRLLGIIRTNSRRVSEIVDNILQLSRRDATRPQMLPLGEWTRAFTTEFAATLELGPDQLICHAEDDVEVRMDPGHLHQIVWNLCENALRHGASAEGRTLIEISFGRAPGSRRPYLDVADRGPGIPPALRERVFEPFATGQKGGTGLGLFISRELAECNRAGLFHEERKGGGSVFRIVFADPARWSA